jgi:hypothetical protein
MAKEYQSEYGSYLIDTDSTGTSIYPNQNYNNPEGESFDISSEEEEYIFTLVNEKLGYNVYDKHQVYYVMDYNSSLPEEVINALHLVIIEKFNNKINKWVDRNFEPNEEDVWEDNYGN